MYRTHAFILAHKERGEADYSITLYTQKFGLIHAFAQGLRKPAAKLQGHLELFSEADVIIVPGRTGYRITGALLLNPYPNLRNSLFCLKIAAAAAVLIKTIAFEGEDEGSWAVLEELFQVLDSGHPFSDREARRALFWFSLNVLRSLGYQLSRDSEIVSKPALQGVLSEHESSHLKESLSRDFSEELARSLWPLISKSYEKNFGYRFLFLRQMQNNVII